MVSSLSSKKNEVNKFMGELRSRVKKLAPAKQVATCRSV